MKMKIVLFLVFIVVTGCASADNIDEKYLKEYFFYSCVDEGHKEIHFQEFDGSAGYVAELLSYDYKVIVRVSNYAKKIASEIPDSEHNNKKSVLAICLEAYEGKELDSVIKVVTNE